jgi:rare lipoprotein A
MQTGPVRAGGAIPGPLSCVGRQRRARLGLVVAALMAIWPAWVSAGPLDFVRSRVGQASWYGHEFAWRRTASGEQFDPHDLTGAHRTLPLGTKVRVTNLRNGRSVLVTINDRGPYRRQREIDLSYGAALALGMVQRGLAPVRIELIDS